jgi:HPt (histidine-containing phosphotransfer) domain-containing protein
MHTGTSGSAALRPLGHTLKSLSNGLLQMILTSTRSSLSDLEISLDDLGNLAIHSVKSLHSP